MRRIRRWFINWFLSVDFCYDVGIEHALAILQGEDWKFVGPLAYYADEIKRYRKK
jgi:hypothetical protein